MAYTARKQSLYGNVGAPNAPTGGVDIAGAIDALSGGAQSLIHSAMLRQQNEAAQKQAAEDRAYQRQRDQAEDQRRDREFDMKKKDSERDFMLKGGVPAHDEATPAPTMASVPMPQSPIRRAMVPQAGKNGLPGVAMTPMGVPAGGPGTAPLPASTLEQTHVPEHVDIRKSADYQKATDVARIRGEVQGELANERATNQAKLAERRIQASKEAAVYAQAGRIELEKLRQAGRGNGIRRGMTANATSQIAEKTADGLIASFGGDRQAAFDWLNSDDPEAASLRELDLPISWGTYLDNSRAKWTKTATSQALSFQRGPMGDDPKDAVKRVDETRNIVAPTRGFSRTPPAAGGAKPAAALPPGAESLALSPLADPASIFRRSAAPAPVSAPGKPTAAAVADTVTDDQFTDAEIDAAIAAGFESDVDVRKYILGERKKKKPSNKPR